MDEVNSVLLGDSVISQYRFKKNYYFVSGDNMANSQDSDIGGMLPERIYCGKELLVYGIRKINLRSVLIGRGVMRRKLNDINGVYNS